jgi:hypothetical protein
MNGANTATSAFENCLNKTKPFLGHFASGHGATIAPYGFKSKPVPKLVPEAAICIENFSPPIGQMNSLSRKVNPWLTPEKMNITTNKNTFFMLTLHVDMMK